MQTVLPQGAVIFECLKSLSAEIPDDTLMNVMLCSSCRVRLLAVPCVFGARALDRARYCGSMLHDVFSASATFIGGTFVLATGQPVLAPSLGAVNSLNKGLRLAPPFVPLRIVESTQHSAVDVLVVPAADGRKTACNISHIVTITYLLVFLPRSATWFSPRTMLTAPDLMATHGAKTHWVSM